MTHARLRKYCIVEDQYRTEAADAAGIWCMAAEAFGPREVSAAGPRNSMAVYVEETHVGAAGEAAAAVAAAGAVAPFDTSNC